jgi:integrase
MADASLRKNRVGVYQIRLRYRDRQYERSLGTRNRRDADDRLGEVRKVLRYLQDGVLTIPQGVDPVDFITSGGKLRPEPKPEPAEAQEAQAPLTLAEAGARYFASFPPSSKEPSTIQTERIHLNHLTRLLGADRPLESFTRDDLQDYVNRRTKERGVRGRVQRKTVAMELATFRQVWGWSLDRPSPTVDVRGKSVIRLPRAEEKEPFKTWDEVQSVLALGVPPAREARLWEGLYLDLSQVAEVLAYVRENARYPWIYPMFCLAAYTGARISEICRARVEDVRLDGQQVVLREKKKSQSKNTTRAVPLAPPLRDALREWLAQHPGGPHLFCKPRHVHRPGQDQIPLTRLTAEWHFKETLKGGKWARLRGWHLFRHSFASNLARSGKVSQSYIDLLMGHQTEAMRRRYQHLFPENVRNAVSALSEMYEPPQDP